jgi:hypothetical protein
MADPSTIAARRKRVAFIFDSAPRVAVWSTARGWKKRLSITTDKTQFRVIPQREIEQYI